MGICLLWIEMGMGNWVGSRGLCIEIVMGEV